jgi:hypothetical protein
MRLKLAIIFLLASTAPIAGTLAGSSRMAN